MTKVTFQTFAELKEQLGQEVAVTDWLDITQSRIDLFGEATGDRQWIHVDPERAQRESPFATTIAQGYLTLSFVAPLMLEFMEVLEGRMVINYGVNRMRFITPVQCGDRIRARFTLQHVQEISGGLQAQWKAVLEIEGKGKPACVAETLFRYYV